MNETMEQKIADALATIGLGVEKIETQGATYEIGSEVKDISIYMIRAYEFEEGRIKWQQ